LRDRQAPFCHEMMWSKGKPGRSWTQAATRRCEVFSVVKETQRHAGVRLLRSRSVRSGWLLGVGECATDEGGAASLKRFGRFGLRIQASMEGMDDFPDGQAMAGGDVGLTADRPSRGNPIPGNSLEGLLLQGRGCLRVELSMWRRLGLAEEAMRHSPLLEGQD